MRGARRWRGGSGTRGEVWLQSLDPGGAARPERQGPQPAALRGPAVAAPMQDHEAEDRHQGQGSFRRSGPALGAAALASRLSLSAALGGATLLLTPLEDHHGPPTRLLARLQKFVEGRLVRRQHDQGVSVPGSHEPDSMSTPRKRPSFPERGGLAAPSNVQIRREILCRITQYVKAK